MVAHAPLLWLDMVSSSSSSTSRSSLHPCRALGDLRRRSLSGSAGSMDETFGR